MLPAGCVSDNRTRHIALRQNDATSHTRNSVNEVVEPEAEIDGDDVTAEAAGKRTKCDWPVNVTWILQHYNDVRRSR